MESDRDMLAIQRKLAHCRQLAKDFPVGPTAKHILELEDELRAELAAEVGAITQQYPPQNCAPRDAERVDNDPAPKAWGT